MKSKILSIKNILSIEFYKTINIMKSKMLAIENILSNITK